jgi:hypothetical protein
MVRAPPVLGTRGSLAAVEVLQPTVPVRGLDGGLRAREGRVNVAVGATVSAT